MIAPLAVALLGQAASARAQDADSLELAVSPLEDRGGLQVEHPDLDPAGAATGALAVAWAENPLRRRTPDGEREVVVGEQLSVRAIAAYTATSWLRLGVAAPAYPRVEVEGAPRSGWGDVRLAALLAAPAAEEEGPRVGVAGWARLPTATPGLRVSTGGPSGGAAAVVGQRRRSLSWSAQAGLDLRRPEVLGEQAFGTALAGGAAASVLALRGLRVGGEIAGRVGLAGAEEAAQDQLEVHAFASIGGCRGPRALLAVGGGVVPGVGSPDVRGVLGVGWHAARCVEGVPRPLPAPPVEAPADGALRPVEGSVVRLPDGRTFVFRGGRMIEVTGGAGDEDAAPEDADGGAGDGGAAGSDEDAGGEDSPD